MGAEDLRDPSKDWLKVLRKLLKLGAADDVGGRPATKHRKTKTAVSDLISAMKVGVKAGPGAQPASDDDVQKAVFNAVDTLIEDKVSRSKAKKGKPRKSKRQAIRRFREELRTQWAKQTSAKDGMKFDREKLVLISLDALRVEELQADVDSGAFDLPAVVADAPTMRNELQLRGQQLADLMSEFDFVVPKDGLAKVSVAMKYMITQAATGALGTKISPKEAINSLRSGMDAQWAKLGSNVKEVIAETLDPLKMTILKSELSHGGFDLPNYPQADALVTGGLARRGKLLADTIMGFDGLTDPGAVPEVTAALQKMVTEASDGTAGNVSKLEAIASVRAGMEGQWKNMSPAWKNLIIAALHPIRVAACGEELDDLEIPTTVNSTAAVSSALDDQGEQLCKTMAQFVSLDFKDRKDVYKKIYASVEGLIKSASDGSLPARVPVATAVADMQAGIDRYLATLSTDEQKKLEPIKVKLASVLEKVKQQDRLASTVANVQLGDGSKPFEDFPSDKVWRLFIDGYRQTDDPVAAYDFDNPVIRPNGTPREGEAGYMACLMKTFADMAEHLDDPLTVDSLITLHDSAVGNVFEDHDPPLPSGMVTQQIESVGPANGRTGFGCNMVLGTSQGAGNFSAEGFAELQERIRQEILATPQQQRKPQPKLALMSGMACYNDGLTGASLPPPGGKPFSLDVTETVPERRQRATRIIATYDDEISKVGTTDQRKGGDDLETAKLRAIVRCCQELEQAHVFQDANCRTIGFLVLNKLLMQNDLQPVILDNPNRLDGFSEDQLIQIVKDGQVAFDSHRV